MTKLTSTPTGFRPSAQGREERATLGHHPMTQTNPNGVEYICFTGCNTHPLAFFFADFTPLPEPKP